MKALALVLSFLLATPALAQDAGTDAPSADSGVVRVDSAFSSEVGTLGPGWWLSPDRMQKVGEKITMLENQTAAQPVKPESGSVAFWIGLAVGVLTGVGGAVFIIKGLDK